MTHDGIQDDAANNAEKGAKRGSRGRQRLSSVTRAISLLKLFSVRDHELGISELAKRLRVAKSTVHRLASALLEEGLLEQNPENNRYRLGVALFGLGTLVRRRMEVVSEAKTFLTGLRAQTGENVRLAILDGTNVVYINDFESPHPVRLRSSIGLSKPAYCTAEGIVLLTGQSPETIDEMLAGELTALTARTEIDPDKIVARINEARRLRYAVDDEESEIGMSCVAAPVFGGDGSIVAGIGVAGPRNRMTKRAIPALATRVVQTADQVSARFGYGLEMKLGA
jgi:IclR family transcriptional regulator, KDG regulon repressor